MANLLRKDLIVMKRNVIIAIPFGIVFLVLTQLNLTMSVAVIAYMLVSQYIFQEDKGRSDIFVNSLPIERGEIVRSKYAGMLLCSLYASVIVCAVTGIAHLLMPELLPGFSLAQAYWSIVAITIFSSFIYPLSLTLSPVLVRFISIILILLYAMLFSMIQFIFAQPGSPLAAITPTQLMIGSGAVAAVLYIASYLISKTIYERKDL